MNAGHDHLNLYAAGNSSDQPFGANQPIVQLTLALRRHFSLIQRFADQLPFAVDFQGLVNMFDVGADGIQGDA